MFQLILLVTVVSSALAQFNAGSCNSRLSTQIRCVRDGVASEARYDSQFMMPDTGTQNRLKQVVDRCFRSQGCYASPVPPSQETIARRDCFRDAKRQLDQQLNRCMDRQIRGFDPPADYATTDLDEWKYFVSRVFNSLRDSRQYCGDNRRSSAIKNCIQQDGGSYNFGQRPPRSQPSYLCQEDGRCWGAMGAQCQQDWNDRVQPELCKCARQLGTDRYSSEATERYKNCLDRRVNTQTPDEDPGPNWLKDYVNNICNNPCKRQRQQFETRRG